MRATKDKPLEGRNFQTIQTVSGHTYKKARTVIVVPTRDGMISTRVAPALFGMMAPPNQQRALLFAQGHEVGQAYDAMIEGILANPVMSKWEYVMTCEDDNIPPMDAHLKLAESIEWGKFDAISGIYFTKNEVGMPMAYGDPDEYRQSGVLDFAPRDIRSALERGQIMEVNGIAMGCALWRMDTFRKIPKPWYVTVADVIPGKGAELMTQDLSFCKKMKQAGMRLAVDFRVRVGHLDVASNQLY